MNDLYNYNFLAEGGYEYPTDINIVPYAKLGIGAYYTEQVTQIGLLYWWQDKWNFGMRPEVGVYYAHPRAIVGFIANVKYNLAFGYNSEVINNLTFLSFGIGAVFAF
jgi:hypothetical protein